MSKPYYSQCTRSVCVSLSAFFIVDVSVGDAELNIVVIRGLHPWTNRHEPNPRRRLL